MSHNTIELATFRELQVNTGVEFVADLVDTFLQETPAILSDLRDASATQNVVRVRRAAHSLKSNGLAFGANALADLARSIEVGDPPFDTDLIDALEVEFARVAMALKELSHV